VVEFGRHIFHHKLEHSITSSMADYTSLPYHSLAYIVHTS